MKAVKLMALLAALALLFTGCAATVAPQEQEKYQRQVYAMDTVMILTAYGPQGEAALDAAEERICELEADLDPELADSSVYHVNEHAGEWVSVSADFLAIGGAANKVAKQTGGALAVQLYELTKLWGFTGGNYRVPEPMEIAAALEVIEGFELELQCELDTGECFARIPAGTSIGFGAVAKGYTADAALEAMAEAGCETAILSLGGNVQTLGRKPDGSDWNVAIMDPDDNGAYAAMLAVGEKAVVTSGDYQRYFEQDGVRYSHILDPETGAPVENGLRSVTVVCDDGARADALSTAMFVLGEEAALDNWRTNGNFELVLITADGRVVVTDGLRDSISEESDAYQYEYAK